MCGWDGVLFTISFFDIPSLRALSSSQRWLYDTKSQSAAKIIFFPDIVVASRAMNASRCVLFRFGISSSFLLGATAQVSSTLLHHPVSILTSAGQRWLGKFSHPSPCHHSLACSRRLIDYFDIPHLLSIFRKFHFLLLFPISCSKYPQISLRYILFRESLLPPLMIVTIFVNGYLRTHSTTSSPTDSPTQNENHS